MDGHLSYIQISTTLTDTTAGIARVTVPEGLEALERIGLLTWVKSCVVATGRVPDGGVGGGHRGGSG